MKIAINTLPNERGGGITYLKNFIPRLANTDHQYIVFTPSERNELDELIPSNVDQINVSIPTDKLPIRIMYEQIILPALLFKHNVDVFYTPIDTTTLLSPCPTVMAIRNPNPYATQPNHSVKEKIKYRVLREFTKFSARFADKVIFVSKHSKNNVDNYFSIDPQKTRVVYHGIDQAKFSDVAAPTNPQLAKKIDNLKPYILSVSTLYKHKNYEELIQAYANLPSDVRSSYSLVIVGGHIDTRYYQSLKRLVKMKNIEERVFFLGEVAYDDIPYVYKQASLFVLPSKLETFGHTLVEAMASETPVIASNATCIPEIVDDAACLYQVGRPSELTTQMLRVINNPSLEQELIENGRLRSCDFTWENTVKETVSTLRKACKN